MQSRAPAMEFPADLAWVNTDHPPRIAGLRGRVGLIWFWSYDSVNCWNMVPDLGRLEDKYHDGLTVVGMHCPKYPHQRDDAAVLQAVNRLRLRHAVANDADFRLWRGYGVEAWPSVALVDAEGRLAALLAGEGRGDEIDVHVARLLDDAASRDLRVYQPSPPASRPEPRRALAFPAAIHVDGKVLHVSDSGHHRVLECGHDGRVLRCFGSGDAGHVDGDPAQACFDDPRGLARHAGLLYVADRGNHCVRSIDLADGRVDTVLGTGRAGRSRPHHAAARATPMNTPLDLCVIEDDLLVAVAGQNQIWRLDLTRGRVSILAGSGALGLVDGDGEEAEFAQPSGLDAYGRHLIVVDAAASAVRFVNIDTGSVGTAIGSGLYEFGDASGARADTRLQNPLAVAADPRGTIHIADSYNGSIKLHNRRSGGTRPLRLDYRLHEPRGLCLAGGRLWIANTNLHEIVCVDLASGVARRVPVAEA